MLEFCKVDKTDHVMTVTLDRPERLNALHPPANAELGEVFDEFAADDDMWVAIITGEGRGFSAGNDLRYQAEGGERVPMPRGFGGLSSRFDLIKPVYAAVNGVAMGGGFEIALACDIIIASENALFALPEPKVGLAALAGGLQRLPAANWRQARVGHDPHWSPCVGAGRLRTRLRERRGAARQAHGGNPSLGADDAGVRAALHPRQQGRCVPQREHGFAGRVDGRALRHGGGAIEQPGLHRGPASVRRKAAARTGKASSVPVPDQRGEQAGSERGDRAARCVERLRYVVAGRMPARRLAHHRLRRRHPRPRFEHLEPASPGPAPK